MLESTLEMITQAASNSLFIFCFCNLIIVMILIGSNSKPSSNFDQDSQIPLYMVTSATALVNHREALPAKPVSDEKKKPLEEVSDEVSHACNATNTEENNNQKNNENEKRDDENHGDIDEEEDNDELRKRVEEFIAKVNREWKAEMLRTSRLV